MSDAYQERQEHLKRHEVLKGLRSSWVQPWREQAEYIQPRRSRFFQSEARSAGRKKEQRIINNTGGVALRTTSAGMMAGITSPARPWFRMTTSDPDLAELQSVKEWLHIAEERIRVAMAKSNLYNALQTLYLDLPLFGTGLIFLDSDGAAGLRAFPVPVGEYCLAQSDGGRVDTMYRETSFSVDQLVKKFGLQTCSPRARDLYANKSFDEPIEVLHVVQPRQEYDPGKLGPRNMPWASCWMETKSDDEAGYLRESGYRTCPIIGPRWNVTGADVYGSGPGAEVLGDVKALQEYERKKAQAISRMIDPPMEASGSLMGRGVTLLPGAVNYVEKSGRGHGLQAVIQVQAQAVEVVEASIREHENRIRQVLYANLWERVSLGERDPRKTATEIAAIEKEKMLQLGPVMERLEGEALQPIVERFLDTGLHSGDIPPPPQELQGQEVHAEYLSIMAQAQKAVGAGAIQQLVAFAQNIAAVKPEVMDKIDTDEAVAQMNDAVGGKPNLVLPPEKVAKIRADRAKAQQQQAAQESALAASQAAKNLAGADMGGDSALTRLGGVAAAQGEPVDFRPGQPQ